MMQGQTKVSVILPVYNNEAYLAQCIDSLIAQTLKEIEIICVDDGSTDGSLEMLSAYAKKEPRLRVISQKNMYAGVARNNGLEAARGEYVMFLDSDDYFSPKLTETTYLRAKETDADIVLFDAKKFDSKTGVFDEEYHYLKEKFLPEAPVFSYRDIPQAIFQVTTPSPWTKLYRRAFVMESGLRFQPLINSNDLYFVLGALCAAQRISVVRKQLVNYRVNTGSSLQSTKSRHPLCFIEAFYGLFERLEETGVWEELRRSYANTFVSAAVYNLETQTDPSVVSRIAGALAQRRMRATGYLDLLMKEYDYPEKVFALRLVLAKETDRRLASLAFSGPYEAGAPRVSVIMPVFNTGKWLERSVRSIMNQTLADLEIICVDDGSTDESPEILKRLALEDERIRVISQDNGGQSSARNAGLAAARGEYVYFFDSDDQLKPEALEYLVGEAHRDDLDLLLFDAESDYESEELKKRHSEFDGYYRREGTFETPVSGEALYVRMRRENAYRCSVCLQLVRRQLLLDEGLTFVNGIVHEDELYSLQLMIAAHRAAHRAKRLFIRTVREDSTMSKPRSFMNCYAYFRVYQEAIRWLEGREAPLDKETDEIVHNWLRYLGNKTRDIFSALPWAQKRCARFMPAAHRLIFDLITAQPKKCGQNSSKPESLKKQVLRRVLPRPVKDALKKLMRRVPHRVKEKVKRLIKW